jgi:putative solute:sodium symporter small subunit
MQPSDELRSRSRFWSRNLRLTTGLLLAWFGVTFGVAYFGRALRFEFFGWPFSWWVAAQGAPIVYLVIVWYFARAMDRLDDEYVRSERA